MLAAVLAGISVLGLFAYAVGGGFAFRQGLWRVVILDTVMYGVVIGLLVGRRLPYALRAGVLVVMPAILGTFFLYNFGFMAAGFPWMLAFPIFASVLLGQRAGAWSVVVMTGILVCLGLLIPRQMLPWTGDTPGLSMMWWISSSSVITLGALTSLSIGYLFDGLGREAMARKAAEMEADRRERLASLGTLTGGIAHDFNNLLQPIVSNAESARRAIGDGENAEPLLDDILRTTDRARMLVRRILSFARPSPGEPEVVHLGTLTLESERLLRAVLAPNVQLATTVEHEVHVLAEPAELQQVLLNLVTNAAHSMPNGGTVEILVKEWPRDETLSETALANVPRIAALVVTDGGIGMSAATLARAFEPFYTTKGPAQGSGLGLATVYATVTAMGGVVRAYSTPGVGTRMEVLVPITERAVERPSEVMGKRTPERGTELPHVVIVDDEHAVLTATGRLVERLGFRVTRFSEPAQLLTELSSLTPTPMMVLSDLAMPGYTGWELATALHAQHPGLPVILMSGHLDAPDVDLQQYPAVRGVLAKPFSTAELREALNRAARST